VITDRNAMLDAIGEVWLQWKPTWNEMIDDIENATGVRLGACEEGEVDLFETLTDKQVRQVMEYVKPHAQVVEAAFLTALRRCRPCGDIAVFLTTLDRFARIGLELERAWPSGDAHEATVEGYPSYLPSFDQFANDLMEWRDAVANAAATDPAVDERQPNEPKPKAVLPCGHVFSDSDDDHCPNCDEE
jgi:hypothetical protein